MAAVSTTVRKTTAETKQPPCLPTYANYGNPNVMSSLFLVAAKGAYFTASKHVTVQAVNGD